MTKFAIKPLLLPLTVLLLGSGLSAYLMAQYMPPGSGLVNLATGVTGLLPPANLGYNAIVKATATGAVTATTLATCPAGTSKFCQYAYWASIECTDLTHLSATGTVSMTFTYVDGSGSSISTAPANTVLSTCVSTSANAKVAMVGPGQTLSYALNAGTGPYSVDYGSAVLRPQ